MKIDLTNESSYREAERLINEALRTGAKHLALDSLRIVDLPPSLEKLTQLESLDLSSCYWLVDIAPLAKLTALQSLDLSRCKQITDLAPLDKLAALHSLNLSWCEQITDLAPLTKLTALQSLDLSWCRQIADLVPLTKLTVLQSLDLSWLKQITDLVPLAKLTVLQSLSLSGGEQISDLAPLAKLTALQSLDLSWCKQISDLAPLAKLTALQSLDFSQCEQISDLASLTKLPELQSLNLSGSKQIADLALLAKLPALQSLNLSGSKQIADLAPLTKLLALQSLDLSMCMHITDLEPLAKLAALQSLNLSVCMQISDLEPLAKLAALYSLNLSWCEQITDLEPLVKLPALQSLNISGGDQIADLAPLAKLTALKSLDLSGCKQITDLEPLVKLTALQSLDLSGCEQITNLVPLAKLVALQSLDFSGCRQITDIEPLAKLVALQSLDLSECREITDFAPLTKLTALHSLEMQWTVGLSSTLATILRDHRNLRSLQLCDIEDSRLIYDFPRLVTLWSEVPIRVRNAPAELLEGSEFENVLDRLIPWQQDILFSGAAPSTELKLFVLGNGRVGKTQIFRRLQELHYDASVLSTHGVTLGRFEVLEAEGGHAAMHLNLWDFGGQDIYLGTHGLFLDDRAIYVVAWHPSHENDSELVENSIPMRNRPLAYWLAYIRSLAGENAPIIVVQTQCDDGDEETHPPLPVEHGFNHLKSTACSAKTEYGLERLIPEIRAAARMLRKRYTAVEIPQSWVSMEHAIRTLRDEGRKTLAYDEFSALCKESNSLAPPGLIAGFLHRAGQVFWREGAFGNDLVLKQDWALSGIYALLERNDTLPQIRERHGRFHLAQLQAKVWKDYGEDEQKLFLDMMTQCGACFPLNKEIYVATELLPSERTMEADIEAVWRNAEANAQVVLYYDFLHDGVVKTILSRIGQKAGANGVYWRTGLCYYDREAHGAVLIRAEWDEGQSVTRRGRIVVMVEGALASRLARHLVDSVESIRIGAISQTVWQRGQEDGKDIRKSEEREAVQAPFSGIAPETKSMLESALQSATLTALFSSSQQSILLFATEWESRHGGLSTFNRELCLALARMGKTVCCVVPQASAEDIKSAGDVRLVSGGDETLQRKLPLPEGFAPDIIIGHGRITGGAAKAQQEDNYRQAKRIHFIHMAPGQIEWYKGKPDAAQQASAREKEELKLMEGAQLVAAVGPLLFRETATLINRLPSNKRPAVCQFNPGFTCVEPSTSPASLHCLLVGRVEDEAIKGIDIAAQALQQLDVRRIPSKPELIVRGAPDGAGTKLQEALKKRFNISVRVREYSSEQEEIAGDYRSAALTLMPSRSEGFGLVALESLRYGTPVLVSDQSGFAELLTTFLKPHELQDYIVETPDDLSQAANNWQEAIFFQLRDIDAAIKRANKLRDILVEQLSWAKSCEQLLKELR